MVITLKDGEVLKGVIEWYDRGCLKLNRDGAPNILLYKSNIKYMHKDGEAYSFIRISGAGIMPLIVCDAPGGIRGGSPPARTGVFLRLFRVAPAVPERGALLRRLPRR